MSDGQQIKQALERATKTVTLRPERGQRTTSNVAVVCEGTEAYVEEAGRTLVIDVGKALGGNDTGPTPSMVLRSAMSSCVAIGIKQWAARRNVPVERIEVAFETDVDARGQLAVCGDTAPGFEETRLNIAVTSTAPLDVIEDLVAVSLKYSPLMDVFQRPQTVRHRVLANSPSSANALSGQGETSQSRKTS